MSQYIPKFYKAFCTACKAWSSTVYALSSGYGKCGVAVIRISGPRASEAIHKICALKVLPQPRQTVLRRLKDPVTNEILDRGIIIWFPGPKSFTGEDTCEFHVHGGHAVISGILNALSKLPGFQPAEPGEFTRRAFHSGKLDLTEVEGLADLLCAETEAQRKQALIQMDGALSSLYNSWRQVLLKCTAHLEAYIDFSEDENIEDNVIQNVQTMLQELKGLMMTHVENGRCGERLRDGVRTVIVGAPNVGKSSLLNTLCKRPAAIVTPIAGTTRDIVELHMNMGGYPVLLADTAGLRRVTKDEVEIQGMARAKEYANSADLILLVADATQCFEISEKASSYEFEKYIEKYLVTLGFNNLQPSQILHHCDASYTQRTDGNEYQTQKVCIVLNKYDLINNKATIEEIVNKYANVVALSCKTGDGFPHLLDKITCNLTQLCGNPSHELPSLTQARHRHHLNQCLCYIDEYLNLNMKDDDVVLATQKLRLALRQMGKITGHVNTEQILDIIFRDFCVGK